MRNVVTNIVAQACRCAGTRDLNCEDTVGAFYHSVQSATTLSQMVTRLAQPAERILDIA